LSIPCFKREWGLRKLIRGKRSLVGEGYKGGGGVCNGVGGVKLCLPGNRETEKVSQGAGWRESRRRSSDRKRKSLLKRSKALAVRDQGRDIWGIRAKKFR